MKPIAFSEREVDLGISDVAAAGRAGRLDRRRRRIPWFAKAFVNRVWARMMGRGFCEPVDEIGELGDRVLPEVHTALADHFIASQFDVKDVFRVVALSTQLSARDSRRRQRRTTSRSSPFPPAACAATKSSIRCRPRSKSPTSRRRKAPPPARFRFPPPPKSTRDLVNEAFGFDPSCRAANVARTMQQAMLLMNNKQVQAQVNADPASGTMLAKLLAEEKDDEAADRQALSASPRPQADARRKSPSPPSTCKTIGDRNTGFEDLLWGLINSRRVFVAAVAWSRRSRLAN